MAVAIQDVEFAGIMNPPVTTIHPRPQFGALVGQAFSLPGSLDRP